MVIHIENKYLYISQRIKPKNVCSVHGITVSIISDHHVVKLNMGNLSYLTASKLGVIRSSLKSKYIAICMGGKNKFQLFHLNNGSLPSRYLFFYLRGSCISIWLLIWERNVEADKKQFCDEKKYSYFYFFFSKKKKLYYFLTTNMREKCRNGRKNCFLFLFLSLAKN